MIITQRVSKTGDNLVALHTLWKRKFSVLQHVEECAGRLFSSLIWNLGFYGSQFFVQTIKPKSVGEEYVCRTLDNLFFFKENLKNISTGEFSSLGGVKMWDFVLSLADFPLV